MLKIQHFYDERTGTLSYVLADSATAKAAILDAVLDYDPAGGRTSTHLADALIDHVRAQGLTVQWILETHAHADHLTAGAYLRDALGARLAIGEHICTVQETWKGIYGLGEDFAADGSQFDELFADGDRFHLGDVEFRAMHTPGHTPACLTYVAEGAAFVGDTLFMPDFGTARCDFPGGDAAQLFRSIHRVLELPPETMLHMCHDYMPDGRPLAWSCTVAEQRRANKHVHDGVSEAEFVAMRTERDKELDVPALLLPAVQVNIRAGRLPPPDPNGTRYLRIPLDTI